MPGWDDFLKENGLGDSWQRSKVARYNTRRCAAALAGIMRTKGVPSPRFRAKLNSNSGRFSKAYQDLIRGGALPEQIEVVCDEDPTTE